ncbi:hypothetical protein PFISCL1PPCAC_24344, partial [Pristionchus fissidentatus]
LCLVTDESTSLTCVKCGAVSPIAVDEADQFNQDVLDNIKQLNEGETDYKNSAAYYERISKILSEKNLPLALLASRITSFARNEGNVALALKFVYVYHGVLRSFLPLGSPALDHHLIHVVGSACTEKPPRKDAPLIMKYFRESGLKCYGTIEEAMERKDEMGIMHHNAVRRFCTLANIKL